MAAEHLVEAMTGKAQDVDVHCELPDDVRVVSALSQLAS